ncbi:MAG: hypothetical protein IT573_07425 [Deltaproteobacteria bacterium]|nr:hypothetical protein [Deltaproteobacteria bacterium]
MVDRIEKSRPVDPWMIGATKETKEDKKRDEGGAQGQENKDSFGESSDFVQLLSKDPRKFVSEKIASNQISAFTYRGVSTHRDSALLEVDITLANGTLIKGAQVALSRQEGMRYISRRPGEDIVVDQLVKGTFLTVARPQQHEAAPPAPAATGGSPAEAGVESLKVVRAGLAWSYYLGFGAMAIAVLLLIYFFTL